MLDPDTPTATPHTTQRLRQVVLGAVATAVATFGAHAVLFGVLVRPGGTGGGCRTGLYPGTYADLIVPVHLAMFAVLATLVAVVARARGALGPRTSAVLGLCTLCALVGTVDHELTFWPAFLGLIAVIPVAGALLVYGIVTTVAAVRSAQPSERWARHARLTQVALWACTVVGLPAALAAAWLNDAGLFCF